MHMMTISKTPFQFEIRLNILIGVAASINASYSQMMRFAFLLFQFDFSLWFIYFPLIWSNILMILQWRPSINRKRIKSIKWQRKWVQRTQGQSHRILCISKETGAQGWKSFEIREMREYVINIKAIQRRPVPLLLVLRIHMGTNVIISFRTNFLAIDLEVLILLISFFNLDPHSVTSSDSK